MSDQRLRELGRKDDVQSKAELLSLSRRLGRISQERIELLAFCRDPAALMCLGTSADVLSPTKWARMLGGFGERRQLGAIIAAAQFQINRASGTRLMCSTCLGSGRKHLRRSEKKKCARCSGKGWNTDRSHLKTVIAGNLELFRGQLSGVVPPFPARRNYSVAWIGFCHLYSHTFRINHDALTAACRLVHTEVIRVHLEEGIKNAMRLRTTG